MTRVCVIAPYCATASKLTTLTPGDVGGGDQRGTVRTGDRQARTRDPQPGTRDPQPGTRDRQPGTRDRQAAGVMSQAIQRWLSACAHLAGVSWLS